MDDETLKIYGYVISSSYRVNTLKALMKKPKFPSQIARDGGMKPNHISTILRQLQDQDLVEIVNPEAKKGRFYRLTELGEEIAGELK